MPYELTPITCSAEVPLNTASKSIPHDKRCEESDEHATAAKVARLLESDDEEE